MPSILKSHRFQKLTLLAISIVVVAALFMTTDVERKTVSVYYYLPESHGAGCFNGYTISGSYSPPKTITTNGCDYTRSGGKSEAFIKIIYRKKILN